MSVPALAQLMAALEATWPAAATTDVDGWRLRDGSCGGKRVSAARALVPAAEVARAEMAMLAAGQRPIFQLTPDQEALDQALAARGYARLDPTLLYLAPIDTIAQKPPPVRLFDIWPPLAIMREIWTEGGIGPARQKVMDRAPAPKTALIARIDDRASGVGFVAIHEGIAMLHAVEVAPRARRKGVARVLLRGAGAWAQAQGAAWMALAVTEANSGACSLYEGLGLRVAGRYHYREKA
ncbi:MAG: GNAT family N-acetyltransferase [Rhodobacteraceae bacterium]|nr:MAG: GNAT family N-acetyltransferase [Paracoccaceae bacterium]